LKSFWTLQAQIVEAQPGEWCRRVQPVIGGLLSFELPREPLWVETTAIGQTEQEVLVRVALADQQSLLGLPGPLLTQDRHGHPV
jgi:hypothetical protein